MRATAWIALIVVLVAIVALAWRTMERKGVERAYTEGVRALADGRPDDARVALDRAIAKRPEWGAAWRQRGFAAAKPADAIADFSKALALDGNDGDAYAARGRAWMQSQVPAKAIGDLDRALAIAEASGTDPATVAAWRAERAAARTAAGDFSAALDDLRSVVAARGTPDDHRNLASALASGGDWQGARDAYDRAIAAAPQAQWFGERALVQIELGNDEAAGDDLERCARADPSCTQNFGALAGQRARDLGREPPSGAL